MAWEKTSAGAYFSALGGAIDSRLPARLVRQPIPTCLIASCCKTSRDEHEAVHADLPSEARHLYGGVGGKWATFRPGAVHAEMEHGDEYHVHDAQKFDI